MAFTAPSGLNVAVIPASYISDIDGKFQSCHDAFVSLQNELPAIVPTGQTANNLGIVDSLTVPSGIVGPTSFMPSFDLGTGVITINHPTFGVTIESRCVISSRIHSFGTATTYDMSTFGLSSTLQRCIIGVSSTGAPQMSMFCGLSEESEDADNADLVLYEFQASDDSSGFHVEAVRCLVSILGDRDGIDKLFDLEVPLTQFHDAYSGSPVLDFIAPFDCEVIDSYIRYQTSSMPPTSLFFTAEHAVSDYAVLNSPVSFAVETVLTMQELDPPAQVPAGTRIYINSAGSPSLTDVAVTLRVRKIHTPVHFEADI